ncbi:MAG: dihydropteroate synthase [Pelolinea sp.]|nr:dihydropteroate synthase [Pelolinea sp.]
MKKTPMVKPEITWGAKTWVMGIINLTPDSFSGDGVMAVGDPLQQALAQAEEFIRDGAHILDLGAVSSRPGAQPVPAEEELKRLLPVLREIRSQGLNALISVDTWKADVAEACLEAGADWINDIWGLRADARLAQVIARHQATVVLMHNRSRSNAVCDLGVLGSSYSGAEYADFIPEVMADLKASIRIALGAGIPENKIILDPGIGFGKTVSQNLALINHLDEFKALGYPLLIGPSRKSFIGQVLDLPVEEREEGTAAAVAVGIARGADIIRVHNVKMMARVAHMTDAITRKPPQGD